MDVNLPDKTVIPVSGVSFKQHELRLIVEGEQVTLERDPKNPYDANAIKVLAHNNTHIGWVPKNLNTRFHGEGPWYATVVEVLRGQTWGLRLQLQLQNQHILTKRVQQTPTPPKTQLIALAPSGRHLGTVLKQKLDTVTIITPQGASMIYPTKRVTLKQVKTE